MKWPFSFGEKFSKPKFSEKEIQFSAPLDYKKSELKTMPIEEAHEEANMMNVKIGADSYDGVIRHKGERARIPTPEDYDKALAALEEMRHLVEAETGSKKALLFSGRLGEKLRAELIQKFRFLFLADWSQEKITDTLKSFKDDEAKYSNVMENLKTAEAKLKDLKEKAIKRR